MTDAEPFLPPEGEQNDAALPDDTQSARTVRFLLTSLIIVAIFILTLFFLIFAYPLVLAPAPTATPTITPTRRATVTPAPFIPTLTSTATPRITRTPMPTFTATPSLTPTRTPTPGATPTPTGPATLTPASPRNDNRFYKLATWTPDKAAALIEQMDYYPYTLARQNITPNRQSFYDAYEFAAFARREALLRFPQADQAGRWRWGLAYNLAQVGSPAAAEVYAELITAGLNAGEAIPETLPGWFAAQEPNLAVNLIPLEPLPGFVDSYLLELRNTGSAYLWLQETNQAFRVQALASSFDFVNRPESSGILSDLNDDGVEDAGFYPAQTPDSLVMTSPDVFDLSQPIAQRMEFLPAEAQFNVGMTFRNYWVVTQYDGQTALAFEATVYPACPATIRRYYAWDGEFFAYQTTDFLVDPAAVKLNECELLVDHAARVWGPKAAAQIMAPLAAVWPPEADPSGSPYPADALDEWRYRLGLYTALAGDFTGAIDWMTMIVEQPATPISRWIAPAGQFLAQYQAPEDIYRACMLSEFCLPHAAIKYLVNTLTPAEFPQTIERLRDWGIEPISSGFFDFDDDGQTERWFTVRHRPLERLEFWILAATPSGGEALFVAEVDSTRPDLYFLETDFLSNPNDAPVAFLEGQTAFAVRRETTTRRPYLRTIELRREYPNRFFLAQQDLEDQLLSGGDPARLYRDLLNLQETPGLLCAPYWTCDRYYYLLGLAAELAGRQEAALDAYLELWRNYSRSPFTTMARFKLEGSGLFPSATPTLSPSPAATTTITPLAPSPTGGVSPTASQTPDPNATETLTPTVTETLLFGPTDTPTPTATETLIPSPTETETPSATP